MNPFDKYRKGFQVKQASFTDIDDADNVKYAKSIQLSSQGEVQRQAAQQAKEIGVRFPKHLFIPEGAESVDLRRVVNLPDGNVDYELFSFTAPQAKTEKDVE